MILERLLKEIFNALSKKIYFELTKELPTQATIHVPQA